MTLTIVSLALAAALFFGLALVLTQAGLKHLEPLPGSCIAISSACAIFVLLAPITVDLSQWHYASAGLFALIGCLFPATVTILTFYANRRIGPAVTGALGNLAPLFAVFIAVLMLGETVSVGQGMAVLVIVAGIILLYRTPRSGALGGIAWAFALPLAAAFIRGVVQPLVKIGLEDWPNPFAAVTIGYVVSALVVLISSAANRRGWPVPFNRTGWLWFAAVGLCNGLAVLCLYQALGRGPVSLVAPLVACYPLATLVFGWAFPGGSPLSRQAVVGIGITVAGVAILLSL
ncbi:MAG: DMT family transporter [Rhodospirillaceae bacterium]|jgi:drug/metabolite transporter (DMT)-like permease|nr:DMT family transporter [Rhodospirillaceae bacterium]